MEKSSACSSFELEKFSASVSWVGPTSSAGGNTQRDDSATPSWIDEQPSKSVVYVTFGSEYSIAVATAAAAAQPSLAATPRGKNKHGLLDAHAIGKQSRHVNVWGKGSICGTPR